MCSSLKLVKAGHPKKNPVGIRVGCAVVAVVCSTVSSIHTYMCTTSQNLWFSGEAGHNTMHVSQTQIVTKLLRRKLCRCHIVSCAVARVKISLSSLYSAQRPSSVTAIDAGTASMPKPSGRVWHRQSCVGTSAGKRYLT